MLSCPNVVKSVARKNHKKTVLGALAKNRSWKKGSGCKSCWHVLGKTVWCPLRKCEVGNNIVERSLSIMPQNRGPSEAHLLAAPFLTPPSHPTSIVRVLAVLLQTCGTVWVSQLAAREQQLFLQGMGRNIIQCREHKVKSRFGDTLAFQHSGISFCVSETTWGLLVA